MTKKSKAEQVEEKVQDAAPAAEQAEQMEGADAARQPSEEELKAMLRGENRQHDEALGDAWAVLLGQNPMAVMPQVVGTVLHDGGTRTSRRVLPCSCRLTKGKSSSPCPPCLSWKACPMT